MDEHVKPIIKLGESLIPVNNLTTPNYWGRTDPKPPQEVGESGEKNKGAVEDEHPRSKFFLCFVELHPPLKY